MEVVEGPDAQVYPVDEREEGGHLRRQIALGPYQSVAGSARVVDIVDQLRVSKQQLNHLELVGVADAVVKGMYDVGSVADGRPDPPLEQVENLRGSAATEYGEIDRRVRDPWSEAVGVSQ